MPAGKHSGKRTQITIPAEIDAQYAALADSLGMAKATLYREILVLAAPSVVQAVNAVRVLKEHPEQAQDILARLVWDSLKQLAEGAQR